MLNLDRGIYRANNRQQHLKVVAVSLPFKVKSLIAVPVVQELRLLVHVER